MLGTITFLIIRYKPYTTMSDRYFDKEAAKSPREVINWNFVRLRKQRFYHLIPMDLFYMTQLKIFTLQICVCCHITISLNSLFMLLFVSQVDRVNDQMLRRNSRRVSFTLRKVHLVLAFVAFLFCSLFYSFGHKNHVSYVFSFASNPYLIHCPMNHTNRYSNEF